MAGHRGLDLCAQRRVGLRRFADRVVLGRIETGVADRGLQLQDPGQCLARLGVELAGLGIDPDLVGRAVDKAQLLLLGLLLHDLEGLGLIAARELATEARPTPEEGELSEEMAQQLRALGYLR